MLHSAPRRRSKRPAFRAVALCAALLAPLAGRALGIDDITPLYFDGSGGQGFSATSVGAQGLAPAFSATGSDLWLGVGGTGSGFPIEIDQALGTVHQNPDQPSVADPVIADSSWTVRNASATALNAPLLVFTSVDPLHAYPIALPPTGLDADLLSLLAYSFAGDDFLYGVIALPDLAPGAAVQVTLRYVVAGPLAPGGALPPLGAAALGSYRLVPEPSTAALLGAGTLWLAAAARSRRR